MKKTIFVLLATVFLGLSLTACTNNKEEIHLSAYTISSGTYANGDMPFDDIPFIQYSISVPSGWTAEESGYWENERYYTFYKDSSTYLYAGESYRKDYMDATSLSPELESEIETLAFGDWTVKLRVIEAIDEFCYYFYIPVNDSYCRMAGYSLTYSQEQQDEFFDIVKTFKLMGFMNQDDTQANLDDLGEVNAEAVDDPAAQEAYDLLLSLHHDATTVLFWYFSDSSEDLQVADAESPGVGSPYRKVGRFQSIAEMKAETERFFTMDFCNAYFYDHAFFDPYGRDTPMYKEVDGALYRNIDIGGFGWPYEMTGQYELAYQSDGLLVLNVKVSVFDQDEWYYFVLKQEDAQWKVNQFYNYTPYHGYQYAIEPAVSSWLCVGDWEDPNDLGADRLLGFYKNQYLADLGGNYTDATPYPATVDEIMGTLSGHFNGLKRETITELPEEPGVAYEYDAANDAVLFYITFDPIPYIISDMEERGESTVLKVLVFSKSGYASYWGALQVQKNGEDRLLFLSNEYTDIPHGD